MQNACCVTQINLHTNEHNQELLYYPFAFKLDRWVESRNVLNDLSNKVCIPNKTRLKSKRV